MIFGRKVSIFFVLFFLFSRCSSIYFQPQKRFFYDPELFGFKREFSFQTTFDHKRIQTLHISSYKPETKAMILQFHGNGENMTSHFLSLVWLVNQGYDLFTFDYRGYGDSEGKPDLELNYKDSVQILDYVHKICKKRNLKMIVYAQSLGGAIAMRAIPDMKDRSNLILIVVDGSFSSFRKVAYSIAKKYLFTPFAFLFSCFLSDRFSPESFIEKISPTPLLIIHGTEDQIIPFDEGRKVFRLARQPKMFWEIKGGKHIGWMKLGGSENTRYFLKFLEQVMLSPESVFLEMKNQSSEDSILFK